MKNKDIVKLEESLREFIVDDYEGDWHESGSFRSTEMFYKYRSLTIDIRPAKNTPPNFKVSIGILEATFNMMGGEKTIGALGGNDERLIRKWLDRGSNRKIMLDLWVRQSNEKIIKLMPFDFK